MPKDGKIHLIKYAPPPSNLPIYQRVDPRMVSFFGRTNYEAALEEKKFIFGINRADRTRHMYIIGKRGVGKTKLTETLIRQDIAYGYGVCVIDPDGDLISSILDFIPEERAADVIVIDPSDTQHSVAFNPLADVEPQLRHQVARGLVEIIERQFGNTWNGQIEHLFRFACLALLDYPYATFKDFVTILKDIDFRMEVAEHSKDETVKRFWVTEFRAWADKYEAEAVTPLINKLWAFIANPFLKGMFAEKTNKIDFDGVLSGEKIVLINLAKGKIGDDNASLLGSLCILKLQEAGIARAADKENARRDFYLYIHEFQGLVTNTFLNFLAESRKYGIAQTISHQYTTQLNSDAFASVLGAIGTMVVFRVGGDDATRLERELTPVFSAKDMINLGMREFYIKLTIEGNAYDPFSAETLELLEPPRESLRVKILERSRRQYATSANRG
ncbi:MAG: type IV secretion system DNA-binding domain-containing protein [Patescibacteria group bacterium]